MNDLEKLVTRLKKINIEVELVGNIPWIYLRSVNGNQVAYEDYNQNHGYTIAWYPVRQGEQVKLADDIKQTFKIIRKYK